jgi:RIO kinase 1
MVSPSFHLIVACADSRYRASPKLKDAEIPSTLYLSLYIELLLKIRRMYHECKLVHADLSEYNIIYHDGHLYVIDVSQSVEHDHPHAFDFLRNDIKNVEEYFGRYGVKCLGLRRCFEFVTKDTLTEDESLNDEDVLKRWFDEPSDIPRAEEGMADGHSPVDDAEAQHEDSIFFKSYIPRTLNEVYDPERDAAAAQQGTNLIYSETIGIVDTRGKTTNKVHFVDDKDSGKSDEEGEHTDDDDVQSSDEASREFGKKPRGHRHEDREAKKVHSFFYPTVSWYNLNLRRNARRPSKRSNGRSAK